MTMFILFNILKDIPMTNTPNQLFVCKCPKCNYPVSCENSDIGNAPNDFLQCNRCKYIFSVSKLDDFHKLLADSFSSKELEYCKGVIPDSQEIEKLNSI
jgi:hypothetical protein